MATKEEKKNMREFIVARLEDSSRYSILNADKDREKVTVKQKESAEGSPVQIEILLHSRKMPIEEYKNVMSSNYQNGIYTANVFFKDGETFMVRLGSRGHFKGNERSLKNYSKEIRDKMIDLRELEKQAVEHSGKKILVYYQPKTQRLEESLRGYKMDNVNLDYSHIKEEDRGFGFVRNSQSLDYKIANENFTILSGPALIRPDNRTNPYNKMAIVTPSEWTPK